MSFRNRPVLDRKHRPRWQDELRSQQLIVAGFAMAIAVAIGIFAAAAWSSFYSANLRQVALVNGVAIQRSEITHRADLIAAQLTATGLDLQSQLGGARDQLIQQQIQAIQTALQSVEQAASDSIVTGMVLDDNAQKLGISVSDQDVATAVHDRRTIPERRKLSIIVVKPTKDKGAPADAEPTEANWAAAKAEIDDVKTKLDNGGNFANLADKHSDDPSKATKGALGWIESSDTSYLDYYTAVKGASVGDVVGPLRSDVGWYLVKYEDQVDEHRDEQLSKFLEAANVTDAEFSDYIRQQLLQGKYRDYFTGTVLGRFEPQRKVAQIFIDTSNETDPTTAAPKIHVRHILVSPIPGADDQSTATKKQWADALKKAQQIRDEAMQPNVDWYELASQSDDPGSATRGGYLGWYDPASLATQFVPAFAAAVGQLEVGEVSQPIKSEFGYHIIQVTDRRASALEEANRILDDVHADPGSFEQIAHDQSEDPTSAKNDGEVGWIIRYQYEAAREDAIFGLANPGDVSELVTTDTGYYIFKLLETSDHRFTSKARRDQIASSGFNRWLQQLKDQAEIWIDPEFAPSAASAAG